MSTMASPIISLTIVYSIFFSGADQRKHQRSAPLSFVMGINRWPVNSPHTGPVTRKMFPSDDVIMKLKGPKRNIEVNTAFFWLKPSSRLKDRYYIYCRIHILLTIQFIPRNMHTVTALLCFVVVIHWLIFPYPPDLLRWHCGNLTIAPVPAKQPWWTWINTSCEFIMNDCITTTKQSTTKPCAYFLGYTVLLAFQKGWWPCTIIG